MYTFWNLVSVAHIFGAKYVDPDSSFEFLISFSSAEFSIFNVFNIYNSQLLS